MANTEQFSLVENLSGRINNLALQPSAENSIFPIFEAVSNSLNAIEEQFGFDNLNKGQIEIEVFRNEDDKPISFKITDNGIGLNAANFKSFKTYDSTYKIAKGGKGVGRLTWLKVFQTTTIESVFEDDGVKRRRSFSFEVNDNNAFTMTVEEVGSGINTGTSIILDELKDGYFQSFPDKQQTISNHLIRHFLQILIAPNCPDIILLDKLDHSNLKDILQGHILENQLSSSEIDGLGELKFNHLFIRRAATTGEVKQNLFFIGHERTVLNHDLSTQLGLPASLSYEDDLAKYVGIVSGSVLDANVSQERNRFLLNNNVWDVIQSASISAAKDFLSEYISQAKQQKFEALKSVIARKPSFKLIVNNAEEYVNDLPLNVTKPEEIFKVLSVELAREELRLDSKTQKITEADASEFEDEQFYRDVAEASEKTRHAANFGLEEYLLHRKKIIDLLDRCLEIDLETSAFQYENEVHKLICPMRVTSEKVSFGEHNLWLIDEGLTFSEFWASDQELRQFTDSKSRQRPDIVFFDKSHLLGEATGKPAVIVEFKRPSRNDYSASSNPLRQIYSYVEKLRGRQCRNLRGQHIGSIDKDTYFFCYLIADITPTLQTELEQNPNLITLPHEYGYLIPHDRKRVSIIVTQYESLVSDARRRMDAFLNRIRIN